ncbi:response regulator [Chitinivibrio alkaliphilus]|uniref:Chemotaxis protein CheY n=1 Tax=Chitinivibrio alkaliphilus ACht1 TaxID=1313304 RepID=U7D6L3_9BACT|nr:response regulator [Chitinivibrio alkaliphilus]ERP31578.1 chemotaxis protein CheY [Chitinivibrio alkaliphilus ACht1]
MQQRILVIEDDPLILTIMEKLLGNSYDVVTMEDGQKALELFSQERFDLVITDIIMPQVEGMEIIMTIREQNKDIPLIAISGGGRIEAERYLDLAKELEVDCTLKKPFDNEQLIEMVTNLLSKEAE